MLGLDWLVEGEGLDDNSCIGLWNKARTFNVCSIVLSTVSADEVVVQGLTCVSKISYLGGRDQRTGV